MDREPSHPDTLRNFDKAYVPEEKIREYALRNPSKKRPFEAIGFSVEAGNWEALRGAILEGLSGCPAAFDKANEWGTYFGVVVPVRGPNGKEAPVQTYWIYRRGVEFPSLATLYVDTDEWARWEREVEGAP
jgi:hypothetical protein